MSRVAKQVIAIPAGVTVTVAAGVVTIKGAKGALTLPVGAGIAVAHENKQLAVTYQEEGTARVRAGYAVNNLLFYGTGGYAAAGVDAGIKNLATNATIFSSSSTRSGWVGGAGLEWGFAPNWSSKFEVLYTKFDNKGFVTALGDGSRSAVTLDDYLFRFGINYRFGGPVVARY